MTQLTAYIEGIGLVGPGLQGWSDSRAILAGESAYESRKTVLPSPAALPPAERRRCGPIVKLSLAVGQEAADASGLSPSGLPTVFSASGADGVNCHEICAMLASSDRQISPTRFHNSVHNASAGYWSIAHGAMASASVLCAHDGSFGAGLLEAITQVVVDGTHSMLIACDTVYPEPLHSMRPIPDEFGVALVLGPQRSARSLAQLEVTLTAATAERLANTALETLRTSIPAARSLPMLCAIARRQASTLVIDYLGETRLSIGVTPC